MAEQILTQVEVDALLKGLSNGDIKTEAEKGNDEVDGVRPYDFANQERTIRGTMPTLDMVNERFCRAIRGKLFSLFRKTVDVAPEGVKPLKYEDFMRNLQVPSSLNIFTMNPLRGSGVLAMDPNLVFLIVDSYFGGDGRFQTRVEGKEFTRVEQTVIKKVVDLVLKEFRIQWDPVHPIEFTMTRAEMNPQFVNIIPPSELVILSTFRMEIEAASDNFYLCLPYPAVEPIKEKLFGKVQSDDSEDGSWSASLKDRFMRVPLSLTSHLGKARINVGELLDLKVGDVIQLDKKAKNPLDLRVEGVPKFGVLPGVQDNNYSVKIVSHKQGGDHD